MEFRSLFWVRLNGGPLAPYFGTRKEFEELVQGFFDENHFLRSGDQGFIFQPKKGDPFLISGREGFHRFAERIFSGDNEQASYIAAGVLNPDYLEMLKWWNVFYVRTGVKTYLFEAEETRDLAKKTRDLVKNIQDENKKTDIFRRELVNEEFGGLFLYLVSEAVYHNILADFFKNKGFPISYGRLGTGDRSQKYSLPFDQLTSEQQKDLKPNQEGNVSFMFHLIMSPANAGGSSIVSRTKSSLKLENVNEFLKALTIIKPLFSKRDGLEGDVAGSFLVSKVSPEALEKANESGIFVIQFSESEDGQIHPHLKQLNSEDFQPRYF